MIMIINGKEVDMELFAYDGCHKIYLIEDSVDLREAQEMGYEIHYLQELEETYNNSCPLKFISNWKLNIRYVKQGEDAVFEYKKESLV